MSLQLSWDYDVRRRQYIRSDGAVCDKDDWNIKTNQPHDHLTVKTPASSPPKHHASCQNCGAPKTTHSESCAYCRT